jgi:hypothetical protein
MSLDDGSTVVTAWRLTVGTGPFSCAWWMKTPQHKAKDGRFCLSLDGNNGLPPSAAEQTLTTEIGKDYAVCSVPDSLPATALWAALLCTLGLSRWRLGKARA